MVSNNYSDTKQQTLSNWVRMYTDSLLNWAKYKVNNQEIAEDLVQETFLSAVKSYENFKGNSSPKTWLFRILNNKIIDHFRQYAKGIKVEQRISVTEAMQHTDSLFDADGNWETNGLELAWQVTDQNILDDPDFYKVFRICIDDLPENWRLVVTSKFIDEKETAEICQELEITASNYWQMLHRAKLLLKKCLEVKWFSL